MQVSAEYCSISMARVVQRLVRLAASFQPSIPGISVRANVALWIRAGLVAAVHALRNVTQLPPLFPWSTVAAAAFSTVC